MKVGDVICVADFYDLCLRKSATLSRTCLGLCRKVGLMEFGLYNAVVKCMLNQVLEWRNVLHAHFALSMLGVGR